MKQIYDKIANEMKLDFKRGFMNDYFDTEYGINESNIHEYDEDDIECCKLDWIHSIKDTFLYNVIRELHKDAEEIDPSGNYEIYYEKHYDGCYDYLVNRVFAREEN